MKERRRREEKKRRERRLTAEGAARPLAATQ
jgi:hypothetical protein